MLNVSPIGRACSRQERNEFEEFDQVRTLSHLSLCMIRLRLTRLPARPLALRKLVSAKPW